MKIVEYKQIDTKTEIRYRNIENEDGTATLEEYEVTVPVMGLAYRDATAEEEAEMLRAEAEMPQAEPTVEEQLADLVELVGVLTEVICND